MVENIQEDIEDKVIDCINSGVAGRLIIFKPEKKDSVADLIIERRGKYRESQMYFQVNSFVNPDDGNLIKDFYQEDFFAEKNFYFLFVYFDEVKQKMGDYVWLVPSLQLRDVADVVTSGDGENLLRFEASIDIKKKNKYSKFLVSTKDLGEFILSALEKGGKFNFKETDFEEKHKINPDSLKDFLCQARANTFAIGATPIDNPRLLASKQLEFQKGDYFYRDIYFTGDKKFVGQEIIYQGSKPIWAMNYMGDDVGKVETNFLKESLLRLADECRLGGNCEYEKREFKYKNQGHGSVGKIFPGKRRFFQAKRISIL